MKEQINRELLAYQCGQQMFCGNKACKSSLDAPKAVSVDIRHEGRLVGTRVYCVPCYDAGKEKLAEIAAKVGHTIEALDGREVYAHA